MGEKISRLIRLFGFLLTITAIFFIGESIWTQRTTILGNVNTTQIAIITFGGGCVYAIGNFLLASAWNILLNSLGNIQINPKVNIEIYGRTQILKYIPGNLISLPSRHLLSHQHGIDHSVLIGAAVFEFAGLLVASGFVSVIGIIVSKNSNVLVEFSLVLLILVLAISCPWILRVFYNRFNYLHKFPFFKSFIKVDYLKLLTAWILYLCFFITTGFVFLWILLFIVSKWYELPLAMVFSIYAISWFTGFVTPGAPAGAGVREAIIAFFLSSYIGEPISALAAVIMRLVTMAGDIIFYAICLLSGKLEAGKK